MKDSKETKKYFLIFLILALTILIIGVVFQLYGINNGKSYSGIGEFLNIFGLIFFALGFLIYGLKKKNKLR